MTGFISIHRKLWDNEIFTKEPMSEREAWIWMISNAAWASTQHRVGSQMVEVPRGSFIITLRKLQEIFGWKSDKRVRTFLSRLEAQDMIGRTVVGQRNAPKTHVTICNYTEYQKAGRTGDAPGTHRGRTGDAVKNKINNKIKDTNVSSDLEISTLDEVSEAIHFFNETAKVVGWPEVKNVNQTRRSALKARFKDIGGFENWRDAITRASKSPLLTGQNSREWRATFDWLCKSANFTKLMEGNYDPRTSNSNGSPQKGFGNGPDPALANAARLAGII